VRPVAEQAAPRFGELLRQLRDDAGLTQEELAEASGLSPRSVSDLERGINRTARKETARLLADALGLSGPQRALFEAAARGRMPAAGTGGTAATWTLPRDIASFTRVRGLPVGTVTMLFSDIEGSTVLLSRLGHLYGEALSAQRAVLRAAISDHRGLEMRAEGDNFFVVFASAVDAVACCAAAQRALAGYDWPGGAAVRVRMGLHSGEPSRHDDDYIGMDVHRAARIAATAHGGQVLMSHVTWQLAQSGLLAELSVRDLGFHRLKDIEEPERIFQLVGPGLAERFPPLKSLGAATSLPMPSTPLVGRESDLDHLRATIVRPGCCASVATASRGLIPKNSGSKSPASCKNPPHRVADRLAARGSGSNSAARSQPRSAGNSDTASTPPATRSHNCPGETTPPGYRHAIPTITTGSPATGPAATATAPAASPASSPSANQPPGR